MKRYQTIRLSARVSYMLISNLHMEIRSISAAPEGQLSEACDEAELREKLG